MITVAGRAARRVGAAFLRDERGTASMEFVVTLPLLLGPLVLFSEYGQALSRREKLDSALADAVQMLAVAPAWPGETEQSPPWLYTHFVLKARDMVADNLGLEPDEVSFTAGMSPDLSNGELRVPFYMVQVTAGIDLDLNLLSIINAFAAQETVQTALRLNSWDQMRYVAAVPTIDNSPCIWDEDPDSGHGNNRSKIGKDGKTDDCDNLPALDTDPEDGTSGHQSDPGANDELHWLWGYTRGNNGNGQGGGSTGNTGGGGSTGGDGNNGGGNDGRT